VACEKLQGGDALRRIETVRIETVRVGDLFPEEPHKRKCKLEILESAPQKRTIKIGIDQWARTYHLAFPYMQFIQMGWSLMVSFTNEPIKNLEDTLYFPPLPNVYSDGVVCLDPKGKTKPKIQDLIGLFWHTNFSREAIWPGWREAENLFCGPENFACRRNPYRCWEKRTEEEGLGFIANMPWSKEIDLLAFCLLGR